MDDIFEQMAARDADRAISGFYTHFIIFVTVIALLAVVNIVTADEFWIHWVVLGWGIGIAAHAFAVFIAKPRQLRELRALRAARRARPTEPLPEPPIQTPDSIP